MGLSRRDRPDFLSQERVNTMIYVTGDTHADIDMSKLSGKYFPEGKALTKSDYVIICGDFGLVWDGSSREKWWQKWLAERPWTTLFVDGNHENFDMLETLPVEEKFGTPVSRINDSIYWLRRGEVYDIDGRSFFAMGGATSHDQGFRREFVSWWRQEMPNAKEMEHALESLDRHDNEVDFVLTHCAPSSVQARVNPRYETDSLTDFLDVVRGKIRFKAWFFGHYHTDMENIAPFRALYHDIIKIG